jgi:hypothetical protein
MDFQSYMQSSAEHTFDIVENLGLYQGFGGDMVFGFETPAFIESQRKQRECLATTSGFDWSQFDLSRVNAAVGKVLNLRPFSHYEHASMLEPHTWLKEYR